MKFHFLSCFILLTSALVNAEPIQETSMLKKFGMQAVITSQKEKGEELANILLDAAKILSTNKDCEVYLIQQSTTEPEKIYISEVWKNEQAHKASLTNPAVREVITRAMPLIAAMNASPTTHWGEK